MMGLTAVLLAAVFLFGSAMGEEEPLKLMVVSDLHYLAPALYENSDGVFETVMKRADGKMTHFSRGLLEGLIQETLHQHPDALIISGDLSFNGELESHLELAAAYKKLYAEGIPVWVIPGNHDINYPFAARYIKDGSGVCSEAPLRSDLCGRKRIPPAGHGILLPYADNHVRPLCGRGIPQSSQKRRALAIARRSKEDGCQLYALHISGASFRGPALARCPHHRRD